MLRKDEKRVVRREPKNVEYVFKVRDCRPVYCFAVSRLLRRPEAYGEFPTIEVKTIYQEKGVRPDRAVSFCIRSRRDLTTYPRPKPTSDWKPKIIGELYLGAQHGHFDMSVPQDSMAYLLTGFATGGFRVITLVGPPLKKKRTRCTIAVFDRPMRGAWWS